MLRVLHVISGIDPQNGGPTVALKGMVVAQRAAGIGARVLSTWRNAGADAHARGFEADGIPITMVGRAWGKLSWHPSLSRTLAKHVDNADVVHVHGVWEEAQYQAMRIARRLRKPYVFTPHGMLATWNMGQNPRFKRLYLGVRLRRLVNTAAAIHFTTDAERMSTASLGLRPPPLVERLGIDLAEFDPPPPKGLFRARFPQLADKHVVLFLGRIDPKKGLDLLIPAFAQAAIPNAALVLAGPDSGGYATQMESFAQRHQVADRVLFTGMLHGQARIEALVDADLFVTTSYAENFCVAVVESLAAGLPVLISDQVNVGELLEDAGVGEVVPLEVPTIASALRRWMSDDARRQLAAARCRQTAEARFAWPAIGARWHTHYATLLAQAEATQITTSSRLDPGRPV